MSKYVLIFKVKDRYYIFSDLEEVFLLDTENEYYKDENRIFIALSDVLGLFCNFELFKYEIKEGTIEEVSKFFTKTENDNFKGINHNGLIGYYVKDEFQKDMDEKKIPL